MKCVGRFWWSGLLLGCFLWVSACQSDGQKQQTTSAKVTEPPTGPTPVVDKKDVEPAVETVAELAPEATARDEAPPLRTSDSELRKAYLAIDGRRMDEAHGMFQSACTLGSQLGCDEAAFHAVHTPGVTNTPMAVADLIRAGGCTPERGTACMLLARIVRSSWMLSPDPDAARRYYDVACKGGEPDACRKFAGFLEATEPERAKKLRGEGCRKVGPRACLSQLERDRNTYLDKACADGHLSSCFQLANFYGYREPPWARPGEALRLYQKVCESRRGDACYQQGELLRVGKAKRDENAAARSYELGCSYGHSTSCFQLGRMVRAGTVAAPEDGGEDQLFKRAEDLARPGQPGDGARERTQSLLEAYAQLDAGRKKWKPPAVYCLQRRWDYKLSKASERSIVEVHRGRIKTARFCRKDDSGEKCRDSWDPRHVSTVRGLFERCEREVLSRDPESHDHHVVSDENGVLSRCVATPWRCHGDCAVDLGFEKVTETPCPN